MTGESRGQRIVALAGGVGGARLVDGLDRTLPAGALTVVVNTGDDFQHWGLRISPDLDTVMYTLAGLSPEERGWGIDGDTFHVLAEAERRGAAGWFQLGDRDLVTHLRRTKGLAGGRTLTEVTTSLCRTLGVERTLLPMSDVPRPTVIETPDGRRIPFQNWLVRERTGPAVAQVHYEGRPDATATVRDALRGADLVIICPSNPYVSIDPILTLDGIAPLLREKQVIAVSPLIGGRAVKGPLAKMVAQIDADEPTSAWVAAHYGDVLDGLLVHPGDAFTTDLPLLETNILIQDRRDRVALAESLLDFARINR
ncbi:MAG: 2-phospho-L-lactate transferase [Myxococcota bacterium]